MNYKIAILIAYAAVYLYGLFLDIVIYRSKNNPTPENVRDIYDAETYKKWRAYHAERCALMTVAETVSFLVFFVIVAAGVMPRLALTDNVYVSALTLLFFMVTIDSLVSAVFDYIGSMKIEEKYGFNNMKLGTFIADEVRSYIISLVMMSALLSLFILIHRALGDLIIVLFSCILAAVLLIISFLYPLLSRMNNKFTPLPEGELRDRLTALLSANGYHVKEIEVMDASRRTTKSNAYFTGYGKTKTIVLFDTLLEAMTTDEIVAVFAHELGHGLHRDTVKNSALGILQMVVVALLAWLTVRTGAIYADFGFESLNYGLALLLVIIVEFPLVSPVFSVIAGLLSRRAEYRADAHAVREGYGEALISGLKKLSRENLADLSPSKIEVALTYSHPPISRRIEAIEREMKNQVKG